MDRQTRIAFLSEHASPLALLGGEDSGGQNVYVDEVTRNLARRGYAVDIFTRRDTLDLPEVVEWSPGVRVVHLSAGPVEFLPKDALWAFMPDFRDAFLHFMERDEARYDLIHGNFWMSGWVATELQHRLNIPAVQIFHAMGATKQRYQGKNDTSPAERIEVERSIIRDVKRIIAQCPAEWDELVHDYGADPGKIHIIPSAVNTQVFRPVERRIARKRVGMAQEPFVVVYVGRMLPRKDVRNVVRAVALLIDMCTQQSATYETALPPIELLLVGGETIDPDSKATPEIGALQRLVNELGISTHVRFVGKRQQKELHNYYSAGDVAVTTPWYEPFGLTPLEGMACARPVIGSAVGGITYTIGDGETGYLVPPRDPQALANRLYELLVHPELRRCMGEAARARVESEFTWPVVALRTSALYENMLIAHRASLAPAHANMIRSTAPLVSTYEEEAFGDISDMSDISGITGLGGE
ncbi:MAG TPA: glycosyltransferase family 1 protein [Ktedonobacter sp.]|nr:glycosyltransferase family 1 protein [Ktedonobacter sp.]